MHWNLVFPIFSARKPPTTWPEMIPRLSDGVLAGLRKRLTKKPYPTMLATRPTWIKPLSPYNTRAWSGQMIAKA